MLSTFLSIFYNFRKNFFWISLKFLWNSHKFLSTLLQYLINFYKFSKHCCFVFLITFFNCLSIFLQLSHSFFFLLSFKFLITFLLHVLTNFWHLYSTFWQVLWGPINFRITFNFSFYKIVFTKNIAYLNQKKWKFQYCHLVRKYSILMSILKW